MAEEVIRPTWAEIDLEAIAHNASVLAGMVAPAALCAVVKADGYGHGAVQVARAAIQGGASWLAVALVEEGMELRRAGVQAPVLVLSEAPLGSAGAVVDAGLVPTVYSLAAINALEAAAGGRSVQVQIKVDTGMGRAGAPPETALELARAVQASKGLHLGGTWTHLAVADQLGDPFTAEQLRRYQEVLAELEAAGIDPGLRHAANSAGALLPDARYDMVRCGIALYGVLPGPQLEGAFVGLRPAMTLRSQVRSVLAQRAGDAPSYGRRRTLARDSFVANVPLGYADGVPWRLFQGGGELLIGGRRFPLAGAVTMDQLVVDCGKHQPTLGEEVVLIGSQGAETVSAEEWAARSGTITYEVVCRIGPRVPRRYRGQTSICL